MPEYGTKFSADWQISRGEWLSAARNEPSKALCRVCDKVFSVKNGGIRDVIKHEETTKHKNNIEAAKSQRRFAVAPATAAAEGTGSGSGSGSQMKLAAAPSPMQVHLSKIEQVTVAEIHQALHIVDTNQAFRSCSGDADRFQKMFPDSQIAKSYSQSYSKVQYFS